MTSHQTSVAVAQRFADAGLTIDVVHCPERAIPGQTLHELVHNDRIIGATSVEAQQKVKTIYQSLERKGPVNFSNPKIQGA